MIYSFINILKIPRTHKACYKSNSKIYNTRWVQHIHNMEHTVNEYLANRHINIINLYLLGESDFL